MFRLHLWTVVLLLSACNRAHIDYATSDASSAEMVASSVAAFNSHVQPVLQKHCAGCHAETQAPKFMSSNADNAHAAVLPKVNFDDIAKSRILARVLTDEHNCGDSCQALGADLQNALNKWRLARRKHSAVSSGKTTVAKKLSNGSATEISYEIGSLINSKYRDQVNVSLTVEPDAVNKVYYLRNMRVRADEIDVYIGTITPLINGARQSSTTFSKLNCKISATASDNHAFELTVMTTGTSVAPADFVAENKLSLAFDGLRIAEESDQPNCWNKDLYNALFTANIKPILTTTCMACHRPPQQPDVASITSLIDNKNNVLAVLKGDNPNHQQRRPIQRMSDKEKDSIIHFLNLDEPD